MDNYRYFTALTSENNRYGYKAAFGENNIRLKFFDKSAGFTKAFYNTEWICKVLYAEIAAKFTG